MLVQFFPNGAFDSLQHCCLGNGLAVAVGNIKYIFHAFAERGDVRLMDRQVQLF